MDRLTKRTPSGVSILKHSSCFAYTGIRCGRSLTASQKIQAAIERLAEIEDILGEKYNLDNLRDVMKAFETKRVLVVPKDGIKFTYLFGKEGFAIAELPKEEYKSPREVEQAWKD